MSIVLFAEFQKSGSELRKTNDGWQSKKASEPFCDQNFNNQLFDVVCKYFMIQPSNIFFALIWKIIYIISPA